MLNFLGEVGDGSKELLRVLDERHQRSQCQSPDQDLAASVPDDQGDSGRSHELHGWIEERIVEDGIEVGFHVPAVEPAELSKFPWLLAKELNDFHSRDTLLIEGVDTRDAGANPTVRLPNSTLEHDRYREERRENGEGHQGQLPVQGEQDDHNADQHEDVAEHGDDTGGEQLVQGIDVRRHSSDQTAHRIPVEKRGVKLLQVPEYLPGAYRT